MKSGWHTAGDAGCLWLAQGLGAGRIPVAPGTFGSIVGLAWLVALLALGKLWIFFAGCLLGIALSVWACGRAEQILRQKDPSSVVLDEVVAVPICFIPWVMSEWMREGVLPVPGHFFSGQRIYATVVVFVLFRIFDIVKPWPVMQSQRLRGGWGVAMDDVLAAFYVALMTLVLVV
jgi:phosphatidylglycerophosphatase A